MMAIIQTQRNRVIAYQPQDDDVFVRISFLAPAGDGKHLRPQHLRYQPISEYQASVDWAVGIADQMAHPIHVLPLNHSDILNTPRFEPFAKMLAKLSDQEREEFRQDMIAACESIILDCDDQQVRAESYATLVQLKAVDP